MPKDLVETLKIIDSTVSAILISGMGGIAHYFYQVQKGEKFQFGMFIINIILAGWLGYVISGFVPNDSGMYWPLLSISGFCTYPLLRLIEKKTPEIWLRIINK